MSERSKEFLESDDLSTLLAAARGGSNEAIGKLLDQYRNYLMMIANEELTSIGHCQDSPSDIVRWTNFEVCRDFCAFQGSTTAEFRSWLRHILLNNLADIRRRVRQPQFALAGDQPADDRSPSSQVAADEVSRGLHAFICKLADDEQRVIELRYLEGKTYAEIATVIGRTPEATRKLWTRTLARIQTHMRRQS